MLRVSDASASVSALLFDALYDTSFSACCLGFFDGMLFKHTNMPSGVSVL